MRDATDTLLERLAECRRLFDHALVERDASATTIRFRSAARPGVAEWVCDLVTREGTCCPFLSTRWTPTSRRSCGPPLVWAPRTWPSSTSSSRPPDGTPTTRPSLPR